jgi:hypothetical protein
MKVKGQLKDTAALLPGKEPPRLPHVKGNVKFTLEYAMKTQTGTRGIALLFL